MEEERDLVIWSFWRMFKEDTIAGDDAPNVRGRENQNETNYKTNLDLILFDIISNARL